MYSDFVFCLFAYIPFFFFLGQKYYLVNLGRSTETFTKATQAKRKTNENIPRIKTIVYKVVLRAFFKLTTHVSAAACTCEVRKVGTWV